MDKISKREESFKKEVKNIAKQYNEEVRIKMTRELQEKILQKNEIEGVDIEESLPSAIIWNDRRTEQEDKRQYENSYIGELEQMIDETKDSRERRELIEKLRIAKTTEKNKKITELDTDISEREDELHKAEQNYLNKCFNLRKSVEDDIIAEMDSKNTELEKAQEAKKAYIEDLMQAKKIRSQVKMDSKIYKAANDEVKTNLANIRKEYENGKVIKSEIKSLEKELEEFRDKYADIDLENRIDGINTLVAKTMGLNADQEIFNSIMDYEEEITRKKGELSTGENSTDNPEGQPHVVTATTKAQQTKKARQFPVSTEQPTVEKEENKEEKLRYSILIGRNAKLKFGEHICKIDNKTVKEGINLTEEATIELLAKYVDIDPDAMDVLSDKINKGEIDSVVLNIIDKVSISEEEKRLIATDYAKNVFDADKKEKNDDKRHIQYDLEDLSKTSFINRLLGKEINSEEKMELTRIAYEAEKLQVAKIRGAYQPDWKSKLLGKILGKEVKAFQPPKKENNLRTHKQFSQSLSPDNFEQQVENQTQEQEENKEITIPPLDINNLGR